MKKMKKIKSRKIKLFVYQLRKIKMKKSEK